MGYFCKCVISRLNIYSGVLQIEKKRDLMFFLPMNIKDIFQTNYEFKCCHQCQNHQRHIPFTGLYSILVMGRFVKKIENLTLSSQKYFKSVEIKKILKGYKNKGNLGQIKQVFSSLKI